MKSMEKTVGFELRKTNNLLSREMSKFGKEFPPPEGHLTEMHGRIVDYLQKAGEEGVLQKDLEQAFTIRKSTASRILKLMEKNGVIERHGVDYDARLKKIVLTPKAVKHHERVIRSAASMEKRITAGIPREELDTFFAVLHKIQRNLEK